MTNDEFRATLEAAGAARVEHDLAAGFYQGRRAELAAAWLEDLRIEREQDAATHKRNVRFLTLGAILTGVLGIIVAVRLE